MAQFRTIKKREMARKRNCVLHFSKQFIAMLAVGLSVCLTACFELDGRDSVGAVESKDEKKDTDTRNAVNVDSLANAIRQEVTNSLRDSLNAKSSDSKSENYDSIAKAIIAEAMNKNDKDTSKTDQSISYTLVAEDEALIENIYGAFANHYSLMYDFQIPDENDDTISIQSPFPVTIFNQCDAQEKSCKSKKVMIKTWISEFTDTATVTGIVGPADSIYLFPNFKFNENALFSVTSAKKAQRQINAYELDNEKEKLFYSESKSVTIHPMHVFGWDELAFQLDPTSIYQYFWYGVWVTPMADSITAIVDEVAKRLPNEELLVYQQYPIDTSIASSSARVVHAVFDVLQSRGIKYVENDGAGSFGQRINYPVETLRKRQGLCIETAVLFASVLERLGFLTSLIIIPSIGHAFVGWLPERPSDLSSVSFEDFYVIETTMIGNENFSFLDARLAAIDKYFDPLSDGSYRIDLVIGIPIYISREYGIIPNNVP